MFQISFIWSMKTAILIVGRSYVFRLKSAKSYVIAFVVKKVCLRISIRLNLMNNKDLNTWLKYIYIYLRNIVIKKSNHAMSNQNPTICGYNLMRRTRKTLSNIGTVSTNLKHACCAHLISVLWYLGLRCKRHRDWCFE